MPAVNPVSFLAPGTASQAPSSPSYRSDLMAALLSRGSRPNYQNVTSPLGGLAEALKEGIQGYMTKRAVQGEEQKKLDRANTYADLLLGPQDEGAPASPHRDALVKALSAGVDPEFITSEPIASRFGIQTAAADPLKLGRDDRLIDPRTHEELVSALPDTPSSYDEYQLGQRDPAFTQYLRDLKEAGATRIENMGNIPPGFEVAYDEYGRPVRMAPIAGSPAALEAEEAASAAEEQETQASRQADIVTQDIDRALSIIEQSPGSTTGPGGALLQNIPGTQARDLRALIDTVKSNVGFDKLQAMRDASPTGGALGQVSEKENALLQSTIGNLEQSQSRDQLRDNLNRVWNIYQDIVHGQDGGPQRRDLGFKGGWAPDIDALIEKYGQ